MKKPEFTEQEKIERAKIILDELTTSDHKIVPLSTIEKTDIKWLIKDVFPYGKISFIVGDPGVGKSLWGAKIVSCLSTGRTIFGSGNGEYGDALIISPEDDSGDTLRPRLEACGADLEKVHFFQKIDLKPKIPISIQYLNAIKNYAEELRIKRHKLKLVLIDPLEEILGDINLNKSTKVRKILGPVADYCKDEGIAFLGILHLNKTDKKAIYKISGSMGLPAIARAVYMVVKYPENFEKRLFLPIKNNYADDTKGFLCAIKINEDEIPYIEFESVVYEDINEILQTGRDKESKMPPARKEILEYLRAIYPKSSGTKEISEALNKSPNNISQMATKLLNDNLVGKTLNNEWVYVFQQKIH